MTTETTDAPTDTAEAESAAPAEITATPETAAPAEIATNQTAEEASVKLTEKAAEEIRRVMQEGGIPESSAVRIGVQGGGCSGFQYSFGFEDTVGEQDWVSEQHGVKVAINMMHELHLAGTVVDFYSDLDRRGFTFNNPNVTRSCGCGSSFSV